MVCGLALTGEFYDAPHATVRYDNTSLQWGGDLSTGSPNQDFLELTKS